MANAGFPPFCPGTIYRRATATATVFYLPEDADGDGRIDHVTVYVPSGIDRECQRGLVRLMRLWNRDGQKWRVVLEAISDANASLDARSPLEASVDGLRGQDSADGERLVPSSLLATGTAWQSTTPYLHPWHVKKNFTIEDQIRRECRERGLPDIVRFERLPAIRVNGRALRPIHFHRFRNKRGLTQPDTRGSFWRIEFAKPVQGPLALGFACHFGLGMFRTVSPG